MNNILNTMKFNKIRWISKKEKLLKFLPEGSKLNRKDLDRNVGVNWNKLRCVMLTFKEIPLLENSTVSKLNSTAIVH